MAAEPDYSILSAFQGPITRPKTSIFYHGGLLLVAATMLLLPLIYLAMVGLVAYAVYYHAFHNWHAIMDFDGSGGGVVFRFIIYFVPLIAGVVVVFFMFKPLLAGRPKHAQPLALNPATERLLYAFIEKICDIVGAPSPKRIDLDCQINAAAGFRRGFFSMFGHDLVLVLGLPLVANLTAHELAGVIAHEFGHFTQGAGMRLNYVINSVNFWFARVAYQRDSWDVALEQWAAEVRDGRIALIIWTVQLSVWFSRLILKILMLIGHTVGGFMMRQMEYDADAYEIKVAGSECFEQTMRKLATLDAAWQATQKQLIASWRQSHTLPDNLPEMIRGSHQRLPAPVLQKIDDTLGFHRTGLFDSHPSPADRIRQARKANDPGIFHDDRPASSLFASFEHPSRFVTLLHYTDDIGIPVTEKMLTRVEVEQKGSAGGAGAFTADSYFLGILPLMKPVTLVVPVPSVKMDADYAELNQLTAGLQQIAGQLEGFAQRDVEFLDQLVSARAAHCLLNNGFGLTAGTFSLPKMNLESAAAAEAEALAARQELRHSLREVMPTLNRRLELGLRLTLANVGEPDRRVDEDRSIADLVARVNENAEPYAQQMELAEALLTLARIKEVRASEGENPAMRRALAAQENRVCSLSAQLNPQSELAQAAANAPRLQISKANLDVSSIYKQNREWLQDYDRKLEELVRLAAPAESFTQA
jgi:Zn-dependent protease with chaperone function